MFIIPYIVPDTKFAYWQCNESEERGKYSNCYYRDTSPIKAFLVPFVIVFLSLCVFMASPIHIKDWLIFSSILIANPITIFIVFAIISLTSKGSERPSWMCYDKNSKCNAYDVSYIKSIVVIYYVFMIVMLGVYIAFKPTGWRKAFTSPYK